MGPTPVLRELALHPEPIMLLSESDAGLGLRIISDASCPPHLLERKPGEFPGRARELISSPEQSARNRGVVSPTVDNMWRALDDWEMYLTEAAHENETTLAVPSCHGRLVSG